MKQNKDVFREILEIDWNLWKNALDLKFEEDKCSMKFTAAFTVKRQTDVNGCV